MVPESSDFALKIATFCVLERPLFGIDLNRFDASSMLLVPDFALKIALLIQPELRLNNLVMGIILVIFNCHKA